MPTFRNTLSVPSSQAFLAHYTHICLPIKMEQTECFETSVYKLQTPGHYPKESILELCYYQNCFFYEIVIYDQPSFVHFTRLIMTRPGRNIQQFYRNKSFCSPNKIVVSVSVICYILLFYLFIYFATPLQAWRDPEGSRRFKLPDLSHEGGKVVSPTHRPPLPPQEIYLVLISVRD